MSLDLPPSAKPDSTPTPDDAFRPFAIRECLANVTPESVSWLWPGRIPLGKLTLIVGDPGLGKSFLTLDLAARLSTGAPWPDRPDKPMASGATVLLSAEDGLADTIRVRLDAAGADVSRIHAITSVQRSRTADPSFFNLADDLTVLKECIRDVGATLAIIDPISAYLSGLDSHNNADIRSVLGPVADLAARCGCAVVAINHLSKGGSAKAIYRALGSIGFVAAARMAWLVGRDKDDDQRRLLLPVKSNLAGEATGLAFEIIDGRIEWSSEPITEDADSIIAADGADRHAVSEATDWLVELLATGPMAVNEIKEASAAACHCWRTIERAKKSLDLVSQRGGYGKDGGWTWAIRSSADVRA